MRRPLLLALLLTLVAAYVLQWRESSGSETPAAQRLDWSELPSLPMPRANPALATASHDQLVEVLHASYRLKPDRRCVGAFAEVEAWRNGTSAPRISARFARDHWVLEAGGNTVAELPELPDFEDCLGALRARAQMLASGGDTIPDGSTSAPPEAAANPPSSAASLIDDLRALDREPPIARRSPEALQRAARDLVWLSFHSLDSLGLADGIRAKAWAYVAIAGASGAPIDREAALLAELLGYSAASTRRAQSLPAIDPVRHFVLHEDEALQGLVGPNEDRSVAALLVLRRLAERGDYPRWVSFVQAHFVNAAFSPVVIDSALRLRAFLANGHFPALMPYLIAIELLRESGDPERLRQVNALDAYTGQPGSAAVIASVIGKALGVEAGDLVQRIEDELAANAERNPGPLLDHSTYTAFYEGYLYSALDAAGTFHLVNRGSLPDAKQFAQQFDRVTAPAARAFATWYRHRIDAEESRNATPLLDDLAADTPLGGNAHFETFERAEQSIAFGSTPMLEAMRRITRQLDTRPEHAAWLATHAYRNLFDLRLLSVLNSYLLSVQVPSRSEAALWAIFLDGDASGLQRVANDLTLSAPHRLLAAAYLRRIRGWSDPAVDQAYRALAEQFPESWSVLSDRVEVLVKTGRYADARAAFAAWLALDLPDSGLQRVIAANGIARQYYREGSYERAWEEVEPLLDSWQFGVLENAGEIREALGDPTGADQIFRAGLSRYPTSLDARLTYVKFLWRQGRYDEAARSFAEHKAPIDTWSWFGKIREAFHEAVARKPDAEILAAFAALKAARLEPMNLRLLGHPFHQEGRYELAFRMTSELPIPGGAGVQSAVESYAVLRRWKGNDEAFKWLQGRLPANALSRSEKIFFMYGENDLLWQAVEPSTTSPPDAEWTWLIRAYSHVRYADPDPARRRALEEHFASPRADEADLLGSYVLGAGSAENIWRRAGGDPRKRVEAAYVTALRSLCDGDYRAASDWLRITVEMSDERLGENHWAGEQLRQWTEPGQSLDRLRPSCAPRVAELID